MAVFEPISKDCFLSFQIIEFLIMTKKRCPEKSNSRVKRLGNYLKKKRYERPSLLSNKILNWAFYLYCSDSNDWHPKSHKIKVKNGFLIVINLPKVNKNSIVIEEINDILIVSGARIKNLLPKMRKPLKDKSIDNGRFKLSYNIKERIGDSRIEASFSDNLLLIKAPSNQEN
jgi:HSP20 family molecular chaperone IbpA